MSWQATSWVIEKSKHKGSALLTLLCIANCANSNGSYARPGMSRLAKDTRMSRRQVIRIIERLEASKELSVKRTEGVENTYSLPLMTSDKMSRVKNLTTRDTIMSPSRDIAMAPIPKDSQNKKKEEPPLSPKRSHKPPEAPIELEPPHRGADFTRELTRYRQVRIEMKSPLTQTMTEALYCKLARYDEETATLALAEATAGGYKGVFPERVNGNGYHDHPSEPQPRRQTIRERLGVTEEEINRISAGQSVRAQTVRIS